MDLMDFARVSSQRQHQCRVGMLGDELRTKIDEARAAMGVGSRVVRRWLQEEQHVPANECPSLGQIDRHFAGSCTCAK